MSTFSFGPLRAEVVAASSTAAFVPLTGWVDAYGISTVKAMLWLVYTANNDKLIVKPAYQTADDNPVSPNTAAAFGSVSVQDNGDKVCTGMVTSLSLTAKRYVRFGVTVETDGGSTPTWSSGEILFAVSGRD